MNNRLLAVSSAAKTTAEPAAHRPLSREPDGGRRAETPRAIRETLLLEEAGQFDSEWRTAMSRSAESLDLAEVYSVLDRWRGIAALTQADPESHRRILRRADRVLAVRPRSSTLSSNTTHSFSATPSVE